MANTPSNSILKRNLTDGDLLEQMVKENEAMLLEVNVLRERLRESGMERLMIIRRENEELKNALEVCKKELEEKKAQISILQGNYERFSSIDDALRTLAEQRREIAAAKEKHQEAVEESDALKTTVKALEGDVGKWRGEADELRGQVALMTQTVADLTAARDVAVEVSSQREADAARLAECVETLEREARVAQDENLTLRNEVVVLERRVEELQSQMQRAAEEVRKMEGEQPAASALITELHQRVTDKDDHITRVESEKDGLMRQASELQQSILALEERVRHLEKEKELLEVDLAKERELEALTELQRKDAIDKTALLRSEVCQMQAAMAAQATQHAELDRLLDSIKSKYTALQHAHSSTERELNGTTQELEAERKKVAEMSLRVQVAEREKETLMQHYGATEENLKDLQSKVQKLKKETAEKDDFQRRIAEMLANKTVNNSDISLLFSQMLDYQERREEELLTLLTVEQLRAEDMVKDMESKVKVLRRERKSLLERLSKFSDQGEWQSGAPSEGGPTGGHAPWSPSHSGGMPTTGAHLPFSPRSSLDMSVSNQGGNPNGWYPAANLSPDRRLLLSAPSYDGLAAPPTGLSEASAAVFPPQYTSAPVISLTSPLPTPRDALGSNNRPTEFIEGALPYRAPAPSSSPQPLSGFSPSPALGTVNSPPRSAATASGLAHQDSTSSIISALFGAPTAHQATQLPRPAAATSFHVDVMRPVPPPTRSCPHCTFENPETADVCEICNGKLKERR